MTIFLENVLALLNKKGISKNKMLTQLGLGKNSFVNWEKRDTVPGGDTLQKIAEYFEVSTDYLLGKTSTEKLMKNLEMEKYTPEAMIPIPVIGKVAAGYTCLAETDIEAYELVSPETINDGYDYAWLRVKGDSMQPLLIEDDLVLVRIQSMVDSGDYAVVIVDDEDGLVKQIKMSENCITLKSINPYYPLRKFKGEEQNRIRIFGKVIESKRKF